MNRKWFNKDGTRMTCTANEGCDKGIAYGGYCSMHHARMKYNYSLKQTTFSSDGSKLKCSFPECENDMSSKSLCKSHNSQMRSKGELSPIGKKIPCSIEDCKNLMGNVALMCKKHNQFAWRYSLTVEQVRELFKKENRKCSNKACLSDKQLCLDHNHACCTQEKFGTSHKVSCGKCNRGWLCKKCNVALGQINDSPSKLLGLIEYLKNN